MFDVYHPLRAERQQQHPALAAMTSSSFSPASASTRLDGSFINNQWRTSTAATLNKRSHGLNDLSAQIRQELDRSIAKHLEKSQCTSPSL